MKNWLTALLRSLALVALFCLTFPARAGITVMDYWRMGEADPGAVVGGTAVTAVDSAGGINLGYSNSLAKYSADVPVSTNVNSTLSVNFTNGAYALAAIPPSLTSLVDNFGVEAWVKATATSGGVIFYVGSTATSGWGLLMDSANQTYAGLYGGVDLPGDGIPVTNATNGVWEDVALIRDQGVSVVYVNGIAQPYRILAGPRPPAGNMGLCTAPQVSTGAQSFTGLVDEVRIFTFTPGQFSTTNLWVSTTLPPPPVLTNRLALGTTNLVEGGAAGSDSVLLNDTLTNNAWTATANSSWLHVSGTNVSGAGNALVVFSYDTNTGAARTGTLTIAGKTVSVTQAPASYSRAQLVNNILPHIPNQFSPALTVDARDNIYFFDAGYGTIWERIASSGSLTNLPSPNFSEEPFLAADNSGHVFFNTGDTVEEWTPGSSNSTTIIPNLQQVVGLCADTNGNVYVADETLGVVEKWIASSNLVTNLFYPTNDDLGLICADNAGDVYMLSPGDDGNDLLEWTALSQTLSTRATQFVNPTALAIDGASNVYIAEFDDDLNQGVALKWSNSLPTPTVTFADGPKSFASMAADAAGNIFYSPSGPGAVKEWTAASQMITSLVSGLPAEAAGFATDSSNNLYIVDVNGPAVEKWTAANGIYSPLITTHLQRPMAAALDAAGNIYVADVNASSVFEFNPAGLYLTTIASNLNYPNGLALDAAGNLYILENGSQDVLEWIAASNSLVSYIPSALLSGPEAIALDVTGRMYIADQGDFSIDAWDPVSQTVIPQWSVFSPAAVAVDGSGNLYSQENDSGEVVRFQPKDGSVVSLGLGNPSGTGLALDALGDAFLQSTNSQSQVAVIPNAFLNTNGAAEYFGAGSGTLPMVVPANYNFTTFAFAPVTDEPWLQITSVANDDISYSFAANTTGDARTAHITVLGQSIAVTQPANPPTLIGPVKLSKSVFSLGLTNLDTNHSYTVLTSTNLTLPTASWTVLGTATNAGSGLMRFTDTTATNSAGFYIAH